MKQAPRQTGIEVGEKTLVRVYRIVCHLAQGDCRIRVGKALAQKAQRILWWRRHCAALRENRTQDIRDFGNCSALPRFTTG